jgi:hypothetical protein
MYGARRGGQIYGAILEAEDGAFLHCKRILAQEPDADAERIAARYTSSTGPPQHHREIGRRGLFQRRCRQAPGRAFAI